MRGQSAIGIHHQLAAREAGIRLKSAIDKPPRWIDQDLRFHIRRQLPQCGLDYMVHEFRLQLAQIFLRGMLAGQNYRCKTHRDIEAVLHRHLRLTVRT